MNFKMKVSNLLLGLLFLLSIETNLYHANKSNLDELEFLSFDKEDDEQESIRSWPMSEVDWLNAFNRSKRDVVSLVTPEDEELGSGSLEPTTILSSRTSSSSTAVTSATSINSSPTTSPQSTQTSSPTSSEQSSTNTGTTLATTNTTSQLTSALSSNTFSVDTTVTGTTSSSQSASSTGTTSAITNTTSQLTSALSSTFTSNTFSVTATTSTLTSTFTSAANNFQCTLNSDCSNVYGGSACEQKYCDCLPPTIIYKNLCYPSFPMIFALQVYIPINMVCQIIFTSPILYDKNFEYVISNIIQQSPVLKDIYLSMKVNSIKFLGDLNYVSQDSVCPLGYYLNAYNQHNEFSRRSVDRALKAVDLQAYQQFLSQCNNTNSLTYNISACWQKFNVEYTVYFNDSIETALQDSQSLEQRRIYYKKLLLDEILVYRDYYVILNKLNDTTNTNKVYLEVDALTDECRAYLIAHNLTDQASYDQCLNGYDDAWILNNSKQNTINKESALNYTFFPERCDRYYKTCAFDHRLCIDTDQGPICECQPNYYSPTGSYNTECIKKCSKNCLNGGQCVKVSNEERCYCLGFFFSDFCQINALIIIIIAAILLFLTSLTCAILWICFAKRHRNRKKKEKEMKRVDGQTGGGGGPKAPVMSSPPNNAVSPNFGEDNDRQWDEILGKTTFRNTNVEAINPAFMSNMG